MQRPSQAARPKKGEFSCSDSEFLSNYPKLCAGMCDEWWDDGKPRTPWALKLTFGPDGALVVLSDKDSKLVCFTTASSFSDCLDAIELALGNNDLSWRKSKY